MSGNMFPGQPCRVRFSFFFPCFHFFSVQRTSIEKFNDTLEKTHNLVYLVEHLDLELPQPCPDSLFVISRTGVTGRYPHNPEKVLEQYTKAKTDRILSDAREILTWLIQKSSKW